MILLNGLPPILGATTIHVLFINIIAIVIEYFIIKMKFEGTKLLLRVILANLVSVIVGTVVIYNVPELIGGAVAKSDTYEYTGYDKFALVVGVLFLFISNVLVETPAYFVGLKNSRVNWPLFKYILIANLVTNLPVIWIYMMFMN